MTKSVSDRDKVHLGQLGTVGSVATSRDTALITRHVRLASSQTGEDGKDGVFGRQNECPQRQAIKFQDIVKINGQEMLHIKEQFSWISLQIFRSNGPGRKGRQVKAGTRLL